MTHHDDTPVTDDVLADEASRAPQILMDASIGRMEDSTREPGLILTKEQIKNIKHYEVAGLALPTETGAVIGYLGYNEGEGAGKGLEPRDFQKTFTLINSHARTWNPLRTDLIAVTSKLQIFADDIKNNGNTMENIYADVNALKKLDGYDLKTLEDVKKLKDELGDRLSEFNLDAQDKSTVSQFSYFLDNIFEAVNRQHTEATDIKKRLDTFSGDLAEKVLPEIKIKIATINNSALADLIKLLSEDIEERAKKIEELNNAYKTSVRAALDAASKLNIIGLAVSIYTGVEAEKIRKARNDLQKEQQGKIAEMRTKDKVLGALHRVRSDLQDLDIIVVDADIATKNLVTVWNKITLFIDRSRKGVEEINDALSLYQFMDHFRSVVRPWETISRDAYQLYEVFDQADKEFRETYGPQTLIQSRSLRLASATMMIDEPDLQAMREAKETCDSAMRAATVYHDATEYLPTLYAKFNHLNSALSQAHSGLTASAQQIFYDLQLKMENIARYQKELTDTEDESDREYILKSLSNIPIAATTATAAETRKLVDHLGLINETFNRESTLTSLNGLTIQAAKLPEDIAALEERKSMLEGERTTLNSAIQAIENKGFADIGAEAILNAETLAALQLAGPQAAVVKAALDLLQKSLADLDAALNYYGLLSLRENRHTRIDEETQKINRKKEEARTVAQRTGFIENIHRFDDTRQIYIREYSKIIASLKAFTTKYALTPNGSEAVEQWSKDAKEVVTYLTAVQ
ncbi:alpha-xenorhabdolysin family binary toxin subunit A [Pseudomonas caspiana]|uniref:alpha-xenorhabdolysin family binary toxin subunit A n=1 Tax=Pseudomonas caspiana TaxID=1451454 RepID=UPI001302BF95|nr:alpha-xenorhabdolysin family binary toxin subunit A [Pseudomonas caspiana]